MSEGLRGAIQAAQARQAIFPNEEVPEQWTDWIEKNAAETTGENEGKWPKITEKKDPMGPPK